MDSAGNKLSPYARMVQRGLAMSNRRLLEWNATLGRTLILGQDDGSYEERDARTYLEEARTSTWWTENFPMS